MKMSIWSSLAILLVAPALAHAQNLASSYQALQDAVAKGDAPAVKQLTAETLKYAREACGEAEPEGQEAKAGWKERLEYGKSVETYTEYALFAVGVKSAPAVTVDLMATLESQNPKSKYLDQGYANYFYALGQSGGNAKIPAIAEKALSNFPENEDLLMVLTDHSMNVKQADRAQAYALRLSAAASKHSKPDYMAQGDWDKKRNNALMRGYYVAGVIAGEKAQYGAADKNLRAALPLIQGNTAMMAPALFHLGVANYQIAKQTLNKAKMLEAAKFSDQCAAITSAYAEQANKNSLNIKAEAAKMR